MCPAKFIQPSHFSDVTVRYFCPAVALAFTRVRSPFVLSVNSVVFLCAEKEMVRAHTAGVVTFMQNTKTIRYRAVMNCVTNPVGIEYLPSHRFAYSPIPQPILVRRPLPTPSSFLYLCPKSTSQTVINIHQKISYGKPQEIRYTLSCDRPNRSPRRGMLIASLRHFFCLIIAELMCCYKSQKRSAALEPGVTRR